MFDVQTSTVSAGTSAGKIPPTSQIFNEKVNVDQQSTPIHHVAGGALLLVAAVLGFGYLNHRANH